MREILFRGRTKSGEWGYGYYLRTEPCTAYPRGTHSDWIVETAGQNGGFVCLRKKYAVDPYTVGQYTGLKDRNGKKIFEGDLLSFDGQIFDEEEGPGVVTYSPGEYVVIMQERCHSLSDLLGVGTVVGNIYDNPELMEAKE